MTSTEIRQKPSRDDLEKAKKKTVPDVLAKNLKILFVGINPGLYTAAIGHHFGRPGNRFWPALYKGGFTRRLLSPYDEKELLKDRYGITNMVPRATAKADELSKAELIMGGQELKAKILTYKPKFVGILGVTSYRQAFDRPKAKMGPQEETLAGANLWVLPNPSGLNAHFQIEDLGRLFRKFKAAVEASRAST